MKYDIVIKNGRIVTSCGERDGDVAVSEGRIAAVGKGLAGIEELDAAGKLITPGAVDMHVHLQMNAGGPVSCDDFYDGTKAAVFGGTTTIVDFVEPGPDQLLVQGLENRKAEAGDKVVIDYGLHMTIGPGQMDKLDQISDSFSAGTRGFKLYMAYDLRLNDGQMLEVLEKVGEAGGLPIVHAENWDVIQYLIAKNIATGNTSSEYHPESRPESFEAEAVSRIIRLAEYAGVPLHIFHISCGAAVDEVVRARKDGRPVTGETCPQYLFINKQLHSRSGIDGCLPVCSPPLRGVREQERMWSALERGEIQVVSTDHCPFTREDKAKGIGRFDRIPGGVPSIEMRFSSIYSSCVRTGMISSSDWIRLCCRNPAELLGYKTKGDIAPGYDADIVIFDPEYHWKISPESLHETAEWTPYEGLDVTGKPETVLGRGEFLVREGEFSGKAGRGRFINPNL